MDFSKTPRHNKVRHNTVSPISEEVKKKLTPVTSWIENASLGGPKLSKKNVVPLTVDTKFNNNNDNTNSNVRILSPSAKNVRVLPTIEEHGELPLDLPGIMKLENESKELSQHSLLAADVETSGSSTSSSTPTSSSFTQRMAKRMEIMGMAGVRVPFIDTRDYSQRSLSSSNLETMGHLEAASRPGTASILKNPSAYDLFGSPKSPGVRLLREERRTVSWSDVHHGQQLTQVREVEYGESKMHRILRQNKSHMIATIVLFVFTMVAILVTMVTAIVCG